MRDPWELVGPKYFESIAAREFSLCVFMLFGIFVFCVFGNLFSPYLPGYGDGKTPVSILIAISRFDTFHSLSKTGAKSFFISNSDL